MSDPNTNPRPGSGNLVWIIAALAVVVAVVWYVMRDTTPATVTTPPVETSQPATPAPAETPAVDAPAADADAATTDEPADGAAEEAPASN